MSDWKKITLADLESLPVGYPTSSRTSKVFVGERGPLTDREIRNLCDKYWDDLVSLAQILGHENLNTTARYTKRTQKQLGEASERLSY